MSSYNADLYLNDAARREELAKAEEILKKYRSRSSNVTTTTTTTNVITEKPVMTQKPVGQKIHDEIVRNEVSHTSKHFTPVEKISEYRSEYVSKIPQQDIYNSRKVEAESQYVNRNPVVEREFHPTTDSKFVSHNQYETKAREYTPPKEFVDDRRSKSLTSPKKAGFMAKVKSLFKRGDKKPIHHETSTQRTYDDQHLTVREDPFDVVYALVKIQRWNDRTGLDRSFTDEGFYTTLKMNRSSLFDRGLTKDHSISSWLRRDRILLDDIIDTSTRSHVKSMLGLSPRDNIRLEIVEDPTSLLNTSEVRSTNYSTNPVYGETSFRERMYPDERMYHPYSTWETNGPVQFSGKPRNILGLGDFKGEGMVQGTNVVSRLIRGTTEAMEHVVSGRRDFEERDHTILGRRDLNYPIRPDQYYNKNDEVFRSDDIIQRDRIPKTDVYADERVYRDDYRTTAVDRDVYDPEYKRPGLMKRTVEGIKATLHGNKEPEYEEGMKPSAGQQIKNAFKGAVISAKEGKRDHVDYDVERVDERHADRRLEERSTNKVYESNVNRASDRDVYTTEEKRPGLMKRTVEGIKATLHGTKEPEYEEGMKPSAGQQIKDAFKSAVFMAKHPHETDTVDSHVADTHVVHNKERIVETQPHYTNEAVVTEKPTLGEKIKTKVAEVKSHLGSHKTHETEPVIGTTYPVRDETVYSKPTVGDRIKSTIQDKKAEMRGGDIYEPTTMTEYDPVVRKNDLADKGYHRHQDWSNEHHRNEHLGGYEKERVVVNKERVSDKFYDRGHPNYNDGPVRYQ